jgi:hypothetical protein
MPTAATAIRADIFDEVVSLLAKYSPPFEVRRDAKNGYHLWSTKPVEIDGRKQKELFFAGVISQKNYVGFYYMPVYTDPERKELFKPELLARRRESRASTCASWSLRSRSRSTQPSRTGSGCTKTGVGSDGRVRDRPV